MVRVAGTLALVRRRAALRSLRSFAGSLVTPGLERSIGMMLASVLRVISARGPRERHVLLCPPGVGNIGDQAMVEAFLHNVRGPVTLLATSAEDFVRLQEPAGDRVTTLPVAGLLYGTPRRHFRALWDVLMSLRTARSLSVVGADVMDGAYDPLPSARRANVASAATVMGVDARVLGFSWGPHSGSVAQRVIRRAQRAGVQLLVRDPISAGNLQQAGVSSTIQSADMVFADDTLAEAACMSKLSHLLPGGGCFAVVNVSGLLEEPDQLSAYRSVVRHLRGAGLRVLIVPHVSRPGIDDVAAGRRLLKMFAGDSAVSLVDTLLAPAEVRSLTRRADVVVTGRMHLGILALSQGTPALIVDSKGKVPGLLALFDRPEWCIASHSDLQTRAGGLIDAILGDPQLRGALLLTAARVRVLAERNFAGLVNEDSPRPADHGRDAPPSPPEHAAPLDFVVAPD